MINSKQIYKIGRQKSILELNDKLQINDFYEETGYIGSELHGKFSRLELVLVDTKEGKKDKSKICKFNFSPEELSVIFSVVKLDPQKYKETAKQYNAEKLIEQGKNPNSAQDFLSHLKINSYKKDANGYAPVSKITLTYEEAMRSSSKWKIAFEIGMGLTEEKNSPFGGKLISLKEGSYQKKYSAFINITSAELQTVIKTSQKYLQIWETYAFPHMLEFRKYFDDRASENNYNEATMKKWNKNPNINKEEKSSQQSHNDKQENSLNNTQNNSKGNTPNNIQNNNQSRPQNNNQNINSDNGNKKCFCSDCNAEISAAVAKYSKTTYGRNLCMKCQNKARKGA